MTALRQHLSHRLMKLLGWKDIIGETDLHKHKPQAGELPG